MRRKEIGEETQTGKSKEEKATRKKVTRKKATRKKARKKDYIKTLCFNVVSTILFSCGCFRC